MRHQEHNLFAELIATVVYAMIICAAFGIGVVLSIFQHPVEWIEDWGWFPALFIFCLVMEHRDRIKKNRG